jgi:hypothetical protein
VADAIFLFEGGSMDDETCLITSNGQRCTQALRRQGRAAAWAAALAASAMLGLAAPAAAQAQAGDNSSGEQTTPAPRPLRGLLGIGLTRGGDSLIVVGYRNSPETSDVRAGQQIDLRAGADWRPGAGPINVQASVGYFSQSVNGLDGRVRFERWPLEVLGLWQPAESWRVGGGLRYVGRAKLLGRGVASGLGEITFKGKVGGLVEGEWLARRNVGFALRYVVEEYEAPNGEKIDGSHFGLRLNFYF